jgi:amidase
VKDYDGDLAGVPYTASCRALEGYVPKRSSELFLRYDRAGLVTFGKTNLPELAILGTTESTYRGPCRNPWNPGHTVGGSSGGSACAVAARIVPMAHGGDGGGSIRIPASACGLFGLKPTRGRVPTGPTIGEGWSGFVQWHVLTRSVRDSAHALDATDGPDIGALYHAPHKTEPFANALTRAPRKLRIAYSKGSLFGKAAHPEVARAVEDAAKLCASLGHELVEAAPAIEREKLVRAYLTIVAGSEAAFFDSLESLTGRKPKRADFEPETWFLIAMGNALTAGDFETARMACHEAARTVGEFFERYDIFLDGTLAHPPSRIGEQALPALVRRAIPIATSIAPRAAMQRALESFSEDALERTANTMLFNMTGHPAANIPLVWGEHGLPIGTQFVGKFGDEAGLFALAAQLEQARPWAKRIPPLARP